VWPTDMSQLESREAERRVKGVLFSSMVGVLVGLMVATFMESEHRSPSPDHPAPVLNDQPNEPNDMSNGNKSRE